MEGYEYHNVSLKRKKAPMISNGTEQNGLTQRAINELFSQVEKCREKHGRVVTVYVSFLQIYNEKVYDLLNMVHQEKGLRIRWNKKDQFQVENLFIFECQSADEVMDLYHKGIKNKVVASHNLNQQSSRSHSLFTIMLESVDPINVDNIMVSKLQLVDLAGSERISQTGTTGITAKESIDINKSLFVLRKVITGLSEKSQSKEHVPYRDSKLTSLLKQSLGGNSYCVMIACLSPTDKFVEENISTLNYATRASYIHNEPQKNIDPKVKQIQELKDKIRELQIELKGANDHIQFLTSLTSERLKVFGLNLLGNQTERESDLNYTPIKKHQTQVAISLNKSQHSLHNVRESKEQANFVTQFQEVDKSAQEINPKGIKSKTFITKEREVTPIKTMKSFSTQTEQQQPSPAKLQTGGTLFTKRNASQPDTIVTPKAAIVGMTDKSKSTPSGLQKDDISDRLIQSVNAVTDLLKSNTGLRDQLDDQAKTIDQQKTLAFQLRMENEELRDKIEVMEGIIASNKKQYDQYVSKTVKKQEQQSAYEFHGNTSKTQDIDHVYKELIDLRTCNKRLEKRIKLLEKQNYDNTKQMHYIGNNEPSRPMFRQKKSSMKINNEMTQSSFNTNLKTPSYYQGSSHSSSQPNLHTFDKNKPSISIPTLGLPTDDDSSKKKWYSIKQQNSFVFNTTNYVQSTTALPYPPSSSEIKIPKVREKRSRGDSQRAKTKQ